MKKIKKDIKNKKLPDKKQKKHELTDKELKGISGGIGVLSEFDKQTTDLRSSPIENERPDFEKY